MVSDSGFPFCLSGEEGSIEFFLLGLRADSMVGYFFNHCIGDDEDELP